MKSRIVEAHQWLVYACARQMQRRKEPIEDLIQVGNVGLLQAVDRFDPAFGVTFRTFASATMLGVLRRHYRSTWRMRVPRRVQELHLAVSRAIETLTVELQRSPTIHDVATHVGVTDEAVIEAMDAGANFWPLSFSQREAQFIEPCQDDQLETAEQRVDIAALLATLPALEQRVLYLRFYQERTQLEIGEQLGMSQVHVSRVMRSALNRLRTRQEIALAAELAEQSSADTPTTDTPAA